MMNNLVVYNKDSNQFELFLYTIFICMMISGKYTENIKIDVLRRKINQYTNWNIYLILLNYLLINYADINNLLISKFIANNQITNNEVYFLTVDLFKGFNLYQYNNRSGNTVFVVPVAVSNETATQQNYFESKDYDSMPVYITDLNNVSKIYLNLSIASTSTTFAPSAPVNSRYVCLLTFVEC